MVSLRNKLLVSTSCILCTHTTISTYKTHLTHILLEPKVISLCHKYKARPVCLYCWITNFQILNIISPKLIICMVLKMESEHYPFYKFSRVRVKVYYQYLICETHLLLLHSKSDKVELSRLACSDTITGSTRCLHLLKCYKINCNFYRLEIY